MGKDVMMYPNENIFEPSVLTKLAWRFTRKTPAPFGGLYAPGLFQTSGYPLDVACFFIVIGLEIYGLANLLNVGVPAVYTICFFMVDIVLAIARHWPEGYICEAENMLIANHVGRKPPESEDEEREQREEVAAEEVRCESGIAARRWISRFFSMLILIAAAAKMIAFYAAQGGEINGITAAICVSYAITAILHITNTGYFLYGWAFTLLYWRDQRSFMKRLRSDRGEGQAKAGKWQRFRISQWENDRIYSAADIHPSRLAEGHSIEVEEKQKGERVIILKTWGLLTDRSLHTLAEEQIDNEAQLAVLRAGIKVQLATLRQDVGERIDKQIAHSIIERVLPQSENDPVSRERSR